MLIFLVFLNVCQGKKMIRVFSAVLFFFATGAFAAEPPLILDSVRLDSINAVSVPLSVRVPGPSPVRKPAPPVDRYFSAYILKAVDFLYANYGLLGYNINSILTHDIVYHTYGAIRARRPPLTMCVAAQMEVILTAYQLYASETGDYSVYDYLPKQSFEGLSEGDIKGHIWVNPEFNAYGTADALINFGMGERTAFNKLKPGAFINLNRTTRTGHAVTFIGYIDIKGVIQPKYNAGVAGFKYFSSQGEAAAGEGGFDYRYAIFSKYGCPEMPYKRDCDVIYSTDEKMLTTGTMLSPGFWEHPVVSHAPGVHKDTVLNKKFFDGLTTDDVK
jgi:hypothetical protein